MGYSWGTPWDDHVIPMGCLWTPRIKALAYSWATHALPMGSSYKIIGIPIGYPWTTHELLTCTTHGLPMGYSRAPHGTPMGYAWATYQMPTGYPSTTRAVLMGSRGMPMGGPWAPNANL